MTTQEPEDTSPEQVAQPETHDEARLHLGERLSQARQAKDITIREASDRLRIRIVYLEALESGDWSDLPEEVYVMGFLRQYTNLLGIDLSDEIASLKTGEYKLTKPFTIPDPPISMNRTWAIVAGVAFLLLLILFNVVDDGEVEQAPPVAKLPLTSPAAPDTAAGPTTQQIASEGEASPPQTATQTPGADTAGVEPADSSGIATAGSPADGQAVRAPAHGHRYELTAVNESVWLQLRAPNGSLVKEALLRGGQSMRVDSEDDYLLLTAGNPLALSISIDDKPVISAGSLGEKNRVLHDYRLPPSPSTDSSDH